MWSVWVEGGDKPGRWMSDWDNNQPIWRGSREAAELHASERRRVYGGRGLRYEVRPAPEPKEN
jgi:hypothetical protein